MEEKVIECYNLFIFLENRVVEIAYIKLIENKFFLNLLLNLMKKTSIYSRYI